MVRLSQKFQELHMRYVYHFNNCYSIQNEYYYYTLYGYRNRLFINEVIYTTESQKFQMEGTGLLKSGTMVNLGESNNVFMKLNRKETPFGLGDNGNALEPYVSVASNDVKRGTKLYIKELDGLKLPDGGTHNGCVRVDDKGWSFSGCQLDWFVLRKLAL